MHDCLIIGGGVIGLSLAYELSTRGRRVMLVDRGEPGCEASWAGAGILPPANAHTATEPLDRLAALSLGLHAEWAARLREETGIDNGFRRCGALYVARTEAERTRLANEEQLLRRAEIEFRHLSTQEVSSVEPSLDAASLCGAWLAPSECQIRNPRHLKALLTACHARGVEIVAGVETHDFETAGARLVAALTSAGRIEAGSFCIASGAWSRRLLARLGMEVPLAPIRGQIVLLATRASLLKHIVNEGPRYLVPRDDGHVLVGSTEEDAGFDKRPTAEGTSSLLQLALELAPPLAAARVERCWAGLRPAIADRLPMIGRIQALANAYVATGHYRSGLTLSPGTAVALAQLMEAREPAVPLTAFRPERF